MAKGYRTNGPKWMIRAGYAMERLEKKLKKSELALPDLAEAVVTANQLLSDLSIGYDELYTASWQEGLIDRRPQSPIASQVEVEPEEPAEGHGDQVEEDVPEEAQEEKDGLDKPGPSDSNR